jgi:nucleoside phosphorylase
LDDKSNARKGSVRAHKEELNNALNNALIIADQIAVSITPDLNYLIDKLPQSDKVKLLDRIEFRDVDRYYMDLANVLDQCGTHIVVLGDPAIDRISKDIYFRPGVEHHCAFFWDIPTYFLLPKGSEEIWRSRIYSISMPPQGHWPQGEIREYTSLRHLEAKFEELLSELQLRDPWYYFPTRSLLEEKIANKDFDVFLCYNSVDISTVKRIGKQLKEREILPWLDKEQDCSGLPWQRTLEEEITRIKSAAVFVGNEGIGPWDYPEIEVFLREFVRRECPVIPVLLPDALEQPELPIFLRSFTWVDFREKDPDPLKQLIWRITGEKGRSHKVVTTQPPVSIQPPPLPSSVTYPSNSVPSIQLNKILIITVTKVEALAVLEVFSQAAGQKWTRQMIGNKTYYNLGVHGGAPIFMVQSEMGTTTPGGALLTVRKAIQDLQPQAVIMCGIAFGLHPDKQQLGDILVARQLQHYEPQKVDLKQGQIPRGDRATSAERLLDRFRSGDIDWRGASTHFGLVLSGEKLVNEPTFRDWLLKTEPEAVGGEMEGAGLYVATREAKVDWILVKAICDWADGTKNKDAQSQAARNAAQFVLHVLQLGGWSGSE